MVGMTQELYYKSFNDFLADASIVYEKLKGDGFDYRYGQVYFNLLFEHRPDSWIKFRVWMGVTPMEVLTQRQGIRLSKGHVIMGGLGLGWMLRKVAEKKSVKKITLIEISDEILDWYGRDLCEQIQEETGTEIEVVCDDVLGHIGKYGDDARYILDIWPDYPTPFDYLKKEWRDALRSVEGQWWGWGVFRGDHW